MTMPIGLDYLPVISAGHITNYWHQNCAVLEYRIRRLELVSETLTTTLLATEDGGYLVERRYLRRDVMEFQKDIEFRRKQNTKTV